MKDKRVAALYALFALSGFCGLIYESIWSHYLKLFVGHAAYAQTLVLAVFMGGMGIGAWLAARFSARLRNLLWAYAAVEAVVGVIALGFHAGFGVVVDWAYATLLPAACGGEGLCVPQWVLAALLILPQSVLLGATFPLMSGGILRLAPDLPGHRIAALYFLNSIGAVFGVLASGFVLIPALGLPGTLLTAGLGNIAVALAVYFIGKTVAVDAPAVAAVPSSDGRAPWLATLLVVALLTGLSSFVYEVVWIRMLAMVFGSATHSFEVMLAAFILGLALGGWWIRTRIDRSADLFRLLAIVQLAMGVLALLTLPLYGHLFDLMAWVMSGLARNEAGYALFTVALKVISLAVMLPATFCAGMTLPLITVALYRGGSGERAIGQVYAANTIGAIFGVLLAVHVLMPMLGLKFSLAVGAALDIALGAWLLRLTLSDGRAPGRLAVGFALAAAAFIAAAPLLADFDPLKMSSGVFRDGRARFSAQTEVVYAKDGKTATVHVVRVPDGGLSLITNGKSDGSVQMDPKLASTGDEVTMTLLGALPLAYRPDASKVALIGFGTGMTSATLLASPKLAQLTTIEIEPAMVEAAQRFRPRVERAYTDARHRIVLDDAKSFFARGGERFDVIVSEPSNPWVSGVASLFTEEFYARMRAHLAEGGLLVQWLQVYEIAPELTSAIFEALARSFPVWDVYAASAGDLIVVAGAGPKLPARSAAIWEMPELKAMLARVGLTEERRLALQYVSNQRALAPLVASHAMPPNSDFFPTLDLNGPKSRFLRASTIPWSQIHTAEVPLLRALDGAPQLGWSGPPPTSHDLLGRQIAYLRAAQLAALVRDGVAPPADRNHIGDLAPAIAIRQRLVTCQTTTPADPSWDPVVRLATETIPLLDTAEAERLWAVLRSSPCAQALGGAERGWLTVFYELAAGRWAGAGEAAAARLAGPEPKTALQRSVLTKIIATSHVLAGRGLQAARLLEAELPRLAAAEREQPWVRLLLAHARLRPN